MNVHALLFGVLICLLTVDARSLKEKNNPEDTDNYENEAKPHGSQRHKRRSWQMNYGYDYPPPANPYYPDRREYDSRPDPIPHIFRLLDEITSYIKRPSPPPQPIYIPYPVPYIVPQSCSCQPKPNPQPNITSRFPDMEDTNQNWGFVTNDDDSDDDGSDGSRPISFMPIVPKFSPKRPIPKLDHGSNQAGDAHGHSSGLLGHSPPNQPKLPGSCDVFALSCCTGSQDKQKQCFNNVGCSSYFDSGNACNQEKLLSIIDAYSQKYSPVQ